ncbi:MAG: histidine phosphatase family protein [Actinomycetota bacterium]|nr:histidine phosphatase family protein [Actinomycetota bacterium]MDP2287703.1 histidine phosphatase family protein [Actinomycetota bacterium]
MTSGQIFLVRHGQTEWSRSGRHTGRTEIPLTEQGESAARAVALVLPKDPDLVLCSPLQRAQQTAALAGLVITETVPDLLEWDYGAWEGLTTAEIRARLNEPDWTIWAEPIPAGATAGEQLAEIQVRTTRVIEKCLPVVEAGGVCVLVAHGHVLRILTATWLCLEPIDGRLFALDPATVSILGFEHEQRVIRTWNAGAHPSH